MSKFGKFLAGATIFTAAAVGVYEVMKKSAAKEETESGTEAEGTDFASRAYTTIRRGTEQVADKVSQEVMPRVKEAVGPKGGEVLDTIGETAGKVKDTVAESVSRVAEILRGDAHETHYSTVDSAADRGGAEETDTEADAAGASSSGQESMEDLVQQGLDMIDAAQKMSETAEQKPAEGGNTAAPGVVLEDASGESFFDDGVR